jgi:chaperonin GroEL (HSP60 family)
MHMSVKNLLLSYEILADRSVKLNDAYLSLLDVYQSAVLNSTILKVLADNGSDPVKITDGFNADQQQIQIQLQELHQLVSNTQEKFTVPPEAPELQAILADIKIMSRLIAKDDFQKLRESFISLINK